MSDSQRVLTFPTSAETYADQLRAAQARVQQAQLVLRIHIAALRELLPLTTDEPEGKAH